MVAVEVPVGSLMWKSRYRAAPCEHGDVQEAGTGMGRCSLFHGLGGSKVVEEWAEQGS